MIESRVSSVREKIWAVYQTAKIEVGQLETADVYDLQHRAEDLQTNEDCSLRMAGEVLRSACGFVLEQRAEKK
jgi:hypothetical protein